MNPEKLVKIFDDIVEKKKSNASNHDHCEDCYWFESFNGINYIRDGECHRYPKIINKDYDDWCGEYKESEK